MAGWEWRHKIGWAFPEKHIALLVQIWTEPDLLHVLDGAEEWRDNRYNVGIWIKETHENSGLEQPMQRALAVSWVSLGTIWFTQHIAEIAGPDLGADGNTEQSTTTRWVLQEQSDWFETIREADSSYLQTEEVKQTWIEFGFLITFIILSCNCVYYPLIIKLFTLRRRRPGGPNHIKSSVFIVLDFIPIFIYLFGVDYLH